MARTETTEMVDRILQDLSAREGLAVPPWEYFTPTNAAERNILGAYRVDLDRIYLNQDYIDQVQDQPARVARLVVHEWRHYWQDQTRFNRDPEVREADARHFDSTFLEQLSFSHTEIEETSPVPARRCGWYVDHQVVQDLPPEVLSTGVVPRISTGRWIRYHLTRVVDEDYVWSMWKKFEDLKASVEQKAGSYFNFRRYIWTLDELHLVRMSRSEPAQFGERHYYKAVPAGLEDPAWDNPQAARLPKR